MSAVRGVVARYTPLAPIASVSIVDSVVKRALEPVSLTTPPRGGATSAYVLDPAELPCSLLIGHTGPPDPS